MATWIRWWEDKYFLLMWGVALLTMLISFLLAYFISWGWIPSIAIALLGGFIIRKIITKRLDLEAEKVMNKINNRS
jgi:hypothetical protein